MGIRDEVTATLYVIGAICAVMWVVAIKVILVEPVLFIVHERKVERAQRRVVSRSARRRQAQWGSRGYRTPAHPTRA